MLSYNRRIIQNRSLKKGAIEMEDWQKSIAEKMPDGWPNPLFVVEVGGRNKWIGPPEEDPFKLGLWPLERGVDKDGQKWVRVKAVKG